MNPRSLTKHIGIVGCSAEGAALCYRTICLEGEQLLGPHAHPAILVHTPSFAQYIACIDADDWDGVAELMLDSARRLAAAGAELLICPDNTIHRALGRVMRRSPLPWLHIAHVVAQQAKLRGLRRLGVMGTRWLVDGEVYPEALTAAGIDFRRPDPTQREHLHRIIMDELVRGIHRSESLLELQHIIRSLAAQECDAVVLGCTELPLVLSDSNCALPTLDSTRLLARAALREAVI